jgi:hypothetical protein
MDTKDSSCFRNFLFAFLSSQTIYFSGHLFICCWFLQAKDSCALPSWDRTGPGTSLWDCQYATLRNSFSYFILDSLLFFRSYLTFQWTQQTPPASGISCLPFWVRKLSIFPGIYSSAADFCTLKIRAPSPVEIVLGLVLLYRIVNMQL